MKSQQHFNASQIKVHLGCVHAFHSSNRMCLTRTRKVSP